jgi:chorismate lyase/3-hydroxybenzoate synthase
VPLDRASVDVHDGFLVSTGERAMVLAARVARAARLDDLTLQDAVARTYGAALRAVRARRWHVVRWWNFIPEIERPGSRGLNRYMIFNIGRHRGYRTAIGSHPDWTSALPAASGVGTCGDDLIVVALAMAEAPVPVENPRQVPAYRYSARYGPLPPCFARASLIEEEGWLIVGGTASVRGEQTMHAGDAPAQLEEALTNLDALIAESQRLARVHQSPGLGSFVHLRAYIVNGADAQMVRTRVREAGVRCATEIVVARLCRPDLLVEIEGVATLAVTRARRLPA